MPGFFRVIDICVVLSNMQPLSDAMNRQEWVPSVLLLKCKIFCSAVNNVNIISSLRNATDMFA